MIIHKKNILLKTQSLPALNRCPERSNVPWSAVLPVGKPITAEQNIEDYVDVPEKAQG